MRSLAQSLNLDLDLKEWSPRPEPWGTSPFQFKTKEGSRQGARKCGSERHKEKGRVWRLSQEREAFQEDAVVRPIQGATGQGGRRLRLAIRLSTHEGSVASARALWVAWWGQQNLGRVGSGE